MILNDNEEVKRILYKIMGHAKYEGFIGDIIIIDKVMEEIEPRHDGSEEVYWVGYVSNNGESVGTISIKRSEVIEQLREEKLKELGI
jgi:hypothetical protein